MKELSKTQEKQINKSVIALIMKKVTNRLLQFSLKDHPLNRFECKKRKISFRLTTCLFIIKRIEIESYEIGSYYAT